MPNVTPVALGVCLALASVVVSAPSAPVAEASGRSLRSQPGIVLGYYVPYSVSSWDSLERNAQLLDAVAPQWVTVDACGNLTSRDDQTLKQFARSRGLKIMPSLLTSSAWLNHQVLADDDTAVHAIEQIVAYTQAENYDGLDLDLEGVDAADRPYLSRFVEWLSEALHASGRELTLAVPAKERDVTAGWLGAWDYAALGASADLITIMAYEYHGPFSGPGSLSPYDWVARVSAFATSQIPAGKVLLGLPVYGYDWNLTEGSTRAVGYGQAMALAEQYGAEIGFDTTQRTLTFSYVAPAGQDLPPTTSPGPTPQSSSTSPEPTTQSSGVAPGRAALAVLPGHTVTVREPPACELARAVPAPATPTPRPETVPGTLETHEVWLEDSQSVAARLLIADRFGAGGVATWRLGLEDPHVWTLFDVWRAP